MNEPQADDLRRMMAQVYDEHADKWMKVDGRLNVLVAGNTGAGKSTLIREFFGPDLATPPEVGTGRSQTMELARYSVPGKPFVIYDTRGFEAGDAEAIGMVDAAIKKMRSRSDEAEQLHMVWLCVEQSVGRFETAHEKFVNRLRAAGVPFIVVVTKSFDDAGALENSVREMLGADVPLVNVLAEEKVSRAGTIPAYGLHDLLALTLELIPPSRQQALLAAQAVSWEHKDASAKKIIAAAVTAAGGSALVPAPGGQIVALAGIQAGMMLSLDTLAGLKPSGMLEYVKMAGLGAARSGGLKLFQLATAQAVKFLPGAGTAAGTVIGAGVGGSVTGALGFSYWHAAKLAAKSGKLVTAYEFSQAYERYRNGKDRPSRSSGQEPEAA